jgi:hypothetical protein
MTTVPPGLDRDSPKVPGVPSITTTLCRAPGLCPVRRWRPRTIRRVDGQVREFPERPASVYGT